MGRSPCCDKNGLKKGPWTPEEDAKLTQYIQAHGPGNWRTLPKNAGLERCGKSCRLRWTNYLRPDIKRGRFSFEEEETIIQLHSVLGNKWSAIAARLPGRTDNEIKNYWNTHIRKRLLRTGIDPVTHAPRLDLSDLSSLLGSPQLNLMNLLRLQTLLNPEALRLAMSLVSSSQNENQLLLNAPHQINNNNYQTQPGLLIQPNQFDNIIDQQIPSYHNNNNNVDDHQSSRMGHFHVGPTNTSSGQVLFQDSLVTTLTPTAAAATNDYGIINPGDQMTMMRAELSSDNNSSFQSLNASSSQNYSLDSVLSTPLNSDERDSFCSDLLRFEIPEGLNFDEFM